MYEARAKALELAIVFMAGRPVEDAQRLLDLAEVFREWLDPPAPASTQPVSPADGDDYPRIQIESPVEERRRRPPPAPPNIQPV